MRQQRYVYFIKPVGMEGPIKIGCSIMPTERLEGLAVWSPFPLEIVAAIQAESGYPYIVKTLKRDYVQVTPLPDGRQILGWIGGCIEDYNNHHPHSGWLLQYGASASLIGLPIAGPQVLPEPASPPPPSSPDTPSVAPAPRMH